MPPPTPRQMVTAWEDESGTHAYAFALVDSELPAGEENALLLFAADSPGERQGAPRRTRRACPGSARPQLTCGAPRCRIAWIDAITTARADPPCPARLVAQMLSINSLEETQRAVLEAPAYAGGARRGSAPPAMLASTLPAPSTSARARAAAEARPHAVRDTPRFISRRLSETPASPSSPGVSWLMERILPDFVKDI